MWQMESLDLSLKCTPARTITNNVGLITPESPDGSKPVNLQVNQVKVEYESPENAPRTTLFRPWDDSPESLSPPQSEDISPTSTNLNTSPPALVNSSLLSLKQESPTPQPSLQYNPIVQDVSPVADSWMSSDYSYFTSPMGYVPSTPVLSSNYTQQYNPVLYPASTASPTMHYNQYSTPNSVLTPNCTVSSLPYSQLNILPPVLSQPTYTLNPLPFHPSMHKRKRADEHDGSPLLAKRGKPDVGGGVQVKAEAGGGGGVARAPCGVCEAPSTGHHYGADVCEGCKGFFRRRVLHKDVDSFVCGRGNLCTMTGRNRIHCKLCRWRKCLLIGMDPSAVRTERKMSKEPNTLADHILSVHQDTFIAVPALYLGRQHAKNIPNFLAVSMPASADLSVDSSGSSLQFILNLPGSNSLSGQQAMYMTTTGVVQVMLVRFLSRFRPEVGAFLFPSGEFLYPAQLDIPDSLRSNLTTLAREMACTGLTDLDLGFLCALVCCDPMDPPPIYDHVLQNLTPSSSASVISLLLTVQELFDSDRQCWTNLKLKG